MKLSLYAGVTVGNQSLYISFDTTENLTLMEGAEKRDFEAQALVEGPVSINIIAQKCCVQIIIN